MTVPFQEEEEELLIGTDPIDDGIELDGDDMEEREVTLEDVEALEEEENSGHKLQTFDPADDGTDNYFDEEYFDK